jgi:adenine-specific DNA-methyltransferase
MKFQKEFERFQSLLKELFQFEASDLDFGIYRILNYKREQIKDFIENRLPEIVESAFEKHKQALSKNIEEEFNKVKEDVKKILGDEAISPTGELNEIFKNTPLGKKYLEIKEQKELLEKIEEIKGQVYNDLYNFFSRFYEDGDFIPQYRYSIKGYKYAIPYNGEEVKLYWATADQYYIKTGLLFRDYTFKIEGIKVVFRVVEAKEELGSNKATKERFFVLDDENPIEINENELVIRFQYRELIDDEVRKYEFGERESSSSKQEKINSKIFATIEKFLKNNKQLEFIKYLIDERKNEKSVLLYHINRFTAKNTRDYFIHKNLKKFLSEQLDYFIKSEVLNYETLSEEKYLDKHITRAKTVKEIGEKIIDFVAQIEDFQKRLWEKKKFVIKTEYVIMLDRIKSWTNEEFYKKVIKKVLNNPHQLKEWEALGLGKIETEEDLEDKKLPIDTRYFDEDFKYELLEKISENVDIDDALDGLLIKSENWQALNTILNKYREKVQTIYIDPPFNKEQDADYLYRVKYKDATWITMLENRLSLAKEILNEKGSIFVRCDYNGNMYVRLLMNEVFGEENFRNEIIVQRGLQTRRAEKRFLNKTDSLFFYLKNSEKGLLSILEVEKEHVKAYRETLNTLKKLLSQEEYQKIEKILNESLWMPFLSMPGEQRRTQYREIFGIKLFPPKGRHWAFSQENLDVAVREGKARLKCANCGFIITNNNKSNFNGKCPQCGREEFIGEILSLYNQINNNWTDLPGYEQDPDFPTKNSEILLKRVIESTSDEGDLVMDFFLGSGTTTAVAHKLKRKWIGIEMGEHFWTVVLPRMKKVLAYDRSGISKEKDVRQKYNENTTGGFFKYQILEQYEDALDNIELKENKLAQNLFKDEYLIKYFLEFETRDSPYLLNIEKLKNPFAYKLKVNLSEVGEPKEMIVDIPETFNYLLGLKIKKIKRRRDNGKTYLFVLGEKEGRDYAIVWREYSDQWKEEDFKKDKEFIKQELKEWKPQVVYVNGQSILTPNFGDFQVELNYIEPKFKRLMEG